MNDVLLNYLTVAQAAKRLRTDRSNVTFWIRKGYLPAVKAGSQWLVPVQAIEDFVRPKPGPKPRHNGA